MQFTVKNFSKRRVVASALDYFRVLSLSHLFSVSRLVIFNFHRVRADGQTENPFDDALFDTDETTFRKELRWMKRQADPISEEDLISFVKKRKPLPRRSFLITFDDGYRDNYERALPILRELYVPATFFVPTDSIEKRELGWWDRVSWVLKNTHKRSFHFRGETFKVENPVGRVSRILTNQIKAHDKDDTDNFIAELQAACEVEAPPADLSDSQLMTWEQIRLAQEKGITIGSHTHTHRILSGLDPSSQKNEMETSKKILESKLGRPVRSIAYPVGGRGHFTDATMTLARECGYDLGFSFMNGVNRMDGLNRFNIQRICNQKDEATYSGVFNLPWIFARGQ